MEAKVKRGTLTVCCIVVLLVAAFSSLPANAEVNIGAGIDNREMTPQGDIASRIEVSAGGRLIGFWSSTMSTLPEVFEGVNLTFFGDFNNYRRVDGKKVFITFDGGKTKYPATLGTSGYQVTMPAPPVGTYAPRWMVEAKDKEKDWAVFGIKIASKHGWRHGEMTFHMFVKRAGGDLAGQSDEFLFACLRGFEPPWATPDPGVLAQQAMANGQPPIPLPQPVSNEVPVQQPVAPEQTWHATQSYKTTVVLSGRFQGSYPATMHTVFDRETSVVVRRNGQFVASGTAVSENGSIVLTISDGSKPGPSDQINIVEVN